MTRLSDDELAAMRARLIEATNSAQDTSFLEQARMDIAHLLNEVHELRQREVTLLEIARSEAALPNIRGKGGRSLCIACGRDADDHRPDCFREKARALLGLAPPPSAP